MREEYLDYLYRVRRQLIESYADGVREAGFDNITVSDECEYGVCEMCARETTTYEVVNNGYGRGSIEVLCKPCITKEYGDQ
jgi:hypothetical protein